MTVWSKIADEIATATAKPFALRVQRSIGGGCINSVAALEGNGQRYFAKLNDASKADMFEAEFAGLQEIARVAAIRVPRPICWGTAGTHAYLVLEWIDEGASSAQSMARFGQDLAQLHRFTADHYGWHRDNTIGSTPQVNTVSRDWIEFWRTHRLGFQLELAARKGYRGRLQRKGDALLDKVGAFFPGYTPQPSLLHGDLWAGNYTTDQDGRPVLFDPAVYYGDREADLAMTELFGGFTAGFYHAYRDAFPLDQGYGIRKTLYNLYHILNHLNLFGGGYGSQAERMIDTLLSEIR
ncbi:MAG: fructosamine kinase family protein [Acidiferrobacterales bacterium]